MRTTVTLDPDTEDVIRRLMRDRGLTFKQAVNEAIPRLVDAGVLAQTTVGKRNRAFEAKELIDSFTALERQLASPDGDTRSSPPSRRVPARRSG